MVIAIMLINMILTATPMQNMVFRLPWPSENWKQLEAMEVRLWTEGESSRQEEKRGYHIENVRLCVSYSSAVKVREFVTFSKTLVSILAVVTVDNF